MKTAAERAPRRAALAFVFVTVFLDMLALGVIAPVLPKLVVGFLHGDTAQASEIYGVFSGWGSSSVPRSGGSSAWRLGASAAELPASSVSAA